MSSSIQPGTSSGGTPTSRSSSSTSNRHLHHEDFLPRHWRSIGHSVTAIIAKAEKVASADSKDPDAAKELNEATLGILRNHLEWGRTISYLVAKLEGKAAEMESLQHYVRSHPSMGRKRKHHDGSHAPAVAGDEKLTSALSSNISAPGP